MVNLRGKIIGGAMFSLKHCNFIINIDNASGEDVKELIELAKFKVKEELNINLQEEVLLLNF
jgi:UDP-N-acetylmuramate dehydrogenase